MEEISIIDLLNKLKSAKNELDNAKCNYKIISDKLEDLVLEFPDESVVRFVSDYYQPYSKYLYNTIKITPLWRGGYEIAVCDEFRSEVNYIGNKEVSEEELVEFLTKNSEWLKKKKSEEEKLKLEEKKRQEISEYQEYLRLKEKFEKIK